MSKSYRNNRPPWQGLGLYDSDNNTENNYSKNSDSKSRTKNKTKRSIKNNTDSWKRELAWDKNTSRKSPKHHAILLDQEAFLGQLQQQPSR